jgi:hypothetical protein
VISESTLTSEYYFLSMTQRSGEVSELEVCAYLRDSVRPFMDGHELTIFGYFFIVMQMKTFDERHP